MALIAVDWDGTLLDSRFRHRKVLADVLELYGVSVSQGNLDDFVAFKAEGRTTVDYLRARFPGLSDANAVASEWVARIELPQYLRLDGLYPEASRVLGEMAVNFRLTLLSARRNEAGFFGQVNALGVLGYFHRVLCVQPGPEAGLKKADALKEHLKCAVSAVIGDTETDEVCATLLGTDFYALNHGFRSADWWRRRGRCSFASLSQIGEAFKQRKGEGCL